MKLSKVAAIPGLALAAGIGLAACGSVKAPALGNNHTLTASAAAPVATKTTHSAKPAPVATTPAAAPKATVAQPAAKVPVLDVSTDGYSGIKPGEIGFSGDGGYVITGIIWSSWGPNEADGTGISNIQGCVPDCATGSETPYTDTIVLSDPQGGQFTQVSSTRDGTVTAGSTLLILAAVQNSPDAAPPVSTGPTGSYVQDITNAGIVAAAGARTSGLRRGGYRQKFPSPAARRGADQADGDRTARS